MNVRAQAQKKEAQQAMFYAAETAGWSVTPVQAQCCVTSTITEMDSVMQ